MACTTKDIIEAVIASSLAIFNTVANTFVILVIYTNVSLQTPVNLLLVNLAIADMIAAVCALPRFIFKLMLTYPEGNGADLLCKFVRDASFIGGQAAAFTLVAIAFERHFAILYPYRRLGRISKGKFRAIVVGSWTFGIVMELPSIYSSKYNSELGICDEYWDSNLLGQLYSVLVFMMDFFVPMVILWFAYFGILKHFWGSKSRVHDVSNMALFRFRKRVTTVLLAVTLSYCICWLPLVLFYMIYHLSKSNPIIMYNSTLYNFAIIFVGLNSCLDPIFYSLQSARFARSLKRLFCCRRKRPLFNGDIQMATFSVTFFKERLNRNV